MKRPSRKLPIIGLVFTLIASACAASAPPTPTAVPPTLTPVPPTLTPVPPASTPTPGPLDLVRTFQDTFNKRDTEGFLALFVDNPFWGLGTSASSTKAVRNNVEYAFEINTRYELSECKLESGAVSCKLAATDDCKPSGVDAYHYDVTFGFKGGKLSAFGGSLANLDEFNALPTPTVGWLDWARQNLPDDFAKYSDSEWAKFRGTGDQASGKLSAREFGQVMARICQGYAEATK